MLTGSVTVGTESNTEIEVNSDYTEDTETNRNLIENVSMEYIVEG